MRFCCIKAFFVFCHCEALQSPLPKGYDQKNTTEENLTPRRTLTFTYSFERKPQTLEETIHEEIEDVQSKYEEKLLEDNPSEVPIVPIEQILKVDSDTTHLNKHLKRKKNKKNSKDSSSNNEPKKGCKSKFKGTRLLKDPSARITRASIIEALYNIESRTNTNNLETALNIESGSQPIDEEDLLESLLIALARRSRSSSGSRSKGKGKGKGKSKRSKRKKRSGSKGKGKSRSRSRKSSKSRSRKSRKKGRSRSSRSESSSAFSKDVEDSNDFDPSEEIENVFSDEFIDFLNDYYSTGSTESASEDIVEQDSEDVGSLDDFLETYYKFEEGSNDGEVLLDDDLDNKSPKVINPKAPSLSSSIDSAPSGNYRDPNGEFNSPTPPLSPTLPKNNDEDIFSDDTLMSKAPKGGLGKDPKMKSPSGGTKVKEGKEPKGTAPSFSDGKESKVKAPFSSKKTKGDEGGADAEAKGVPSPSRQQVPKRVKKVKTSNGGVDVFSDDTLDDDSLETILKKSGSSSTKSSSSDRKDKSPSSSRKKQKKEKSSKRRQRKLRHSRK